jgi:2-keto-4-pentenoate hydratase/2-oxohepta-3-ene-1,7-dioic acid hydratase in catechol pathway
LKYVSYKPSHAMDSSWRIGVLVEDKVVDYIHLSDLGDTKNNENRSFQKPAHHLVNTIDLLEQYGTNLGSELSLSEVAHLLKLNNGRLMASDTRPQVLDLSNCVLDAPIRPRKLITVARNYREHLEESGVKNIGSVPSASIKASSSLVGPYHDIVRPKVESQLDYETELAVIIGKRCKNVPVNNAYDVIAGYTVLSDIIAREVLKIERDAGNQFLGKMFDTFGPLGHCIVTKDEIKDPMNLRITTTVNGEVRQDSNTQRMIWSIPMLIAYFSQATLEPGDIISTGTPAGVAAGRKPDQPSWYLEPGDIIESEVEGVGKLRNRVVQDTSHPDSWNWRS